MWQDTTLAWLWPCQKPFEAQGSSSSLVHLKERDGDRDRCFSMCGTNRPADGCDGAVSH
ncbi:uncharacterized protein B0I36DRAFT_333638 [Microdochium trichocladiopsis]|uniref:Uncharacterized protein n=1 Tax=Microdochium trichocladiopsis TaxID=1682393 RepID=A0A9P8XV47_9PEZI|nr:uncharacterized protein B0I36DRAFT_333638 [Microdochium trichocladiopsis]KAH7021031.1 hypothetical protein B0I36DRAFT_333638 [Microdochium trichocladiopsis]